MPLHPVLMNAVAAGYSRMIEMRHLEDISRERHCEHSHEERWPACSHQVVAKQYTACRGTNIVICKNVLTFALRLQAEFDPFCYYCGIPVAICWRIETL